jgi:OmpA-OmpF porin, OOP family
MSYFKTSKNALAQSCRTAVMTLPILAGCTYASVGEVRELGPHGSSFADALSREYQQVALYEADEMADWVDAEHFASKALDVASGDVRDPEKIESWDIEEDKIPELSAARERLMTFLTAGAGNAAPMLAAKAQASFDCWVEQQEEGHQFDHIALCRNNFYSALEEVEPVIKPQATILFDFDSDVMDEQAQATLNAFAEYVSKFVTGAVVINGYADRAGTHPHNYTLSKERSIAVSRQLINAGVSPDRIAISANGETNLAIDTLDGMREPLNRRAEVELRLPPLYANIVPATYVAAVVK